MGNQTSSSHEGQTLTGSRVPRNFLRSGALGLSKAELDKRCQPSGLYPSCQWEEKAIRRLIGDGKLAARLKGTDARVKEGDRECPICFLHYSEINVTKCCQANICTECYLQVRPQREKTSCCPFCNSNRVQVIIAKQLDEKAIEKRQQEEQLVIEATIRARGEAAAASHATNTTGQERAPDSLHSNNSGFGSSLERNERVALMRARSSSMASDTSHDTPIGVGDIASLAMTPEERQILEAEMRAQNRHPLAQRLEQEEAERRLQNEMDYYRTQTGRLRELRARRELLSRTLGTSSLSQRAQGLDPQARSRSGRDWNRIVDAFESSGNGSVQSLDDLVVLEAAIMLSMEEEARRREQPGDSSRGSQEGGETSANFDAARHASAGFPLALGRASRNAASSGTASASTSASNSNSGADDLSSHVQSLMRSLQSRRRRDRPRSQAPATGTDTTLDTASMLIRGISEEEQIAMAIAASLEEQGAAASSEGEPDGAVSGGTASVAPSSTEGTGLEAVPEEAGHDEEESEAPARVRPENLSGRDIPSRATAEEARAEVEEASVEEVAGGETTPTRTEGGEAPEQQATASGAVTTGLSGENADDGAARSAPASSAP